MTASSRRWPHEADAEGDPQVRRSSRTSATTSAARCMQRAKLMEEEGHRIIKLNIGNLAPFGFDTPDEVRHDVIVNLPQASGLFGQQGTVLRAQGDHAVHAAEGHRRRRARRHLHRQRRLRADRDVDAGPARRRRRGAGARARLSAVDGRREPRRRAGAALPLRRGVRLAAGPRRHPREDHADRTRAIVVINPNNPTGALYPDDLLRDLVEIARAASADRPVRRDLRQDALRRRAAHVDRSTCRRRAVRHVQRPVEELPRVRLPQRLDGPLRRQAPRGGLHRRPQHPRLDAPVLERAGPVRDPDGARRLPEHRRPGRARRPAREAARSRLRH